MKNFKSKNNTNQEQLDITDNTMGIVLFFLSIIFSVFAVAGEFFMGWKTAYVFVFYFPLLISGIMFHKSAVYLGVFLGCIHVALAFAKNGMVTMDSIVRFAILVISSICIRYLTNAIEEKQSDIVIQRNTLKQVIKSIGDGVIAVDTDKKIILMNEACERMTGWKSSEAEGVDISNVFIMSHQNENYFLENPIDEVLRTNMSYSLKEEVLLISRNGDCTCIKNSASPILNSEGEIVGVVMTLCDVTGEKADRERIEYLGNHDPLTGLYNRRFMKEEMIRMDSSENYPIAILVGDIDNLKLINDAFGHTAGDNVLVEIADTIKKHVHKHDVVVRSGGDTFVVIMTNTNVESLEKMVSDIENACNDIWTESGNLSITFGWNSRLSADEDRATFYKRAEDHMYKRKLNNLPSMRGKSLQTSMNILFVKSPREKMHSERVSLYCVDTAKALGMDARDIEDLKTVSLLHDIGKIIISEAVLEKKGKLTADEWDEMKRHPKIGYRIVRDSLESKDIAVAILNHHERWDGKGYPQGIKGKNIHYYARIIAIADSYDAMISERPYKDALTEEEATHEIIINSGKQFDPELARLFVEKVLKRSCK